MVSTVHCRPPNYLRTVFWMSTSVAKSTELVALSSNSLVEDIEEWVRMRGGYISKLRDLVLLNELDLSVCRDHFLFLFSASQNEARHLFQNTPSFVQLSTHQQLIQHHVHQSEKPQESFGQ
jgi:hypothetical protein